MMRGAAFLFLTVLFIAPRGEAWTNPRDAIGNRESVRLQQGRRELTAEEKKEIEMYGVTGLEVMSYVKLRQIPGDDFDAFYIETSLDTTGVVERWVGNMRWKWSVEDPLSRLGVGKLPPDQVMVKRMVKTHYPSKIRGSSGMNSFFFKSKQDYKREKRVIRDINLKRVRSISAPDKSDKFFGLDVTWDDWFVREPWEENHRIIGEDTLNGVPCLVIESKNWFTPNYYLSRRVVWVDRERFLDRHEEQFDHGGLLFKIINKEWRVLDSGHFVWTRWHTVDLATQTKSMEETADWRVDSHLKEEDFSPRLLETETIWREPKDLPAVVRKASDFPPDPKVKEDFWGKIGAKIEVLNKK